ncbi:hypothetical protein N2152v2_011141 [Parachlorella kessleri]
MSAYLPFGGSKGDVEQAFPEYDNYEAALRWGFVRKVYGILGLQLTLTAVVATVIMTVQGARDFLLATPGTCCEAASVGAVCTLYQPAVVIEAVALTAAIVIGLTLYTFYATSKGVDFSFMGPMLFGCLMAVFVWGILQIFFPPGPVGRTIYSLVVAVLFCGYIVFDTHMLMERHSLDEYVWASVSLYLDIINLFLQILRLLGDRRE